MKQERFPYIAHYEIMSAFKYRNSTSILFIDVNTIITVICILLYHNFRQWVAYDKNLLG